MKVRLSNPRSSAIDYVSAALRLPVPRYTHHVLVDLPSDTAEQWISQFEKDLLKVERLLEQPAKQETPVKQELMQEAEPEEPPAPAVPKTTPKSGKFTPASKKTTARK